MSRKKNIKFVTLYNSFQEKEKMEFRKFIRCPLFNKGRDYCKLLESLEKNNLDFKKIDAKAKDRTIWNRLSELTLLAEKFIVYNRISSDKFLFNSFLLQEYNDRNLNSHFVNTFSDAERYINNKPQDKVKLNKLSDLNTNCLKYLSMINDSAGYNKYFFELNRTFIPLLLLELLEKLILTWELKVPKPSFNDSSLEDVFENIDFEKILSILKSRIPEYYHLVAFNYFIYKSLEEPYNNEHYIQAKKMFIVLQNKVSKEYLHSMYVNMINSLINMRNKNHLNVHEDLFFIIKNKLKLGITDELRSKDFFENHFRDYVFIACSLNKINWAQNFIKKYSELLPVQLKDQILGICKGLICFKKGNFTMCSQIMEKLNSGNPFIYIDKAKLIIISSYELNEIEKCHSVLKSLNEFLRRPRIVQDQLIYYAKKFSKGVSLLLRLKESPVKKNLLNLEYFLSKENFESVKWISEKMKQLRIV